MLARRGPLSAAGSSAVGAPMLAAGGAVVGSGVVGSLETATTELLSPKCQVVRISWRGVCNGKRPAFSCMVAACGMRYASVIIQMFAHIGSGMQSVPRTPFLLALRLLSVSMRSGIRMT